MSRLDGDVGCRNNGAYCKGLASGKLRQADQADFAYLNVERKRPNVTLIRFWLQYRVTNAGKLHYR